MIRGREAGFTLLEMMIALAIFSVVSLAGYQMMQGVLRNGEMVQEHGVRLSDVDRLLALLMRDLSQTTLPAHPARLAPDEAPFIASNHGKERLRLTRRNWLNPQQEPRSSLQRVAWHLSAGTLSREDLSSGQRSAQFSGIQSLQLRFYAGGGWHDRWTASHGLPRAIDVILTVPPWGEIRQIALLPEGNT